MHQDGENRKNAVAIKTRSNTKMKWERERETRRERGTKRGLR